MYTVAQSPLVEAEYDDRKWPKLKIWPKNNFHIRPKKNIGRICTMPKFGRQAEAEHWPTTIWESHLGHQLWVSLMVINSENSEQKLCCPTQHVSVRTFLAPKKMCRKKWLRNRLYTCLPFGTDRLREVRTQWDILARTTNFPSIRMLLWPADGQRASVTVMLFETTCTHEPLMTQFAPESEILLMDAFMLAQVRATGERSAAFLASMWLHPGVCNNVRFQLVRPVKLLSATCNKTTEIIPILS